MRPLPLLWITAALTTATAACTPPVPQPFGPVPSEAQVAWQRMEINMFCHFGPNTFTNAEWGTGQEAEELFYPTELDCRQWVDVACQAGMGGIILTAKHHDGFCLWPSAYSTHTVAQSTWNEGHGDVLHQLRNAVDEHNSQAQPPASMPIKMGVYISPWDRNHPSYGTPEYNNLFANTLREVHSLYGPLFEQWFDGACGEGPNGKQQEYDWPLFEGTVLDINSQCIIFSDVGPGCRWVGNEEGHAGETNWSRLRVESGERRTENGGCGTPDGDRWIPSEVDVSIRPGWFWHKEEHPKTVDELMEIYFNSVGRNGLLLLNVPPDTRGRIPAEDSAVLVAFRAKRDRIFSHDLTLGAKAKAPHLRGYNARNVLDTAYHTFWVATDTTATLTLKLDGEQTFDIIMLQEYIPLGQRVSHFSVIADGQPIAEGTTIGYKRLLRLPHPVSARTLTITFTALATPIVNRIALYNSKTQ